MIVSCCYKIDYCVSNILFGQVLCRAMFVDQLLVGVSAIAGYVLVFFFFSSRRRHTRLQGDWSSDVCSSDLTYTVGRAVEMAAREARERLLDVAAEELEISPEGLEIVDGAVQPVGVPAKAIDRKSVV